MTDKARKLQLLGEIVQLIGIIAIGCGLILGVGHWRFEIPTICGLIALIGGRRLRLHALF